MLALLFDERGQNSQTLIGVSKTSAELFFFAQVFKAVKTADQLHPKLSNTAQ